VTETTINDFTFRSDGESSTQIGNFQFNSDGPTISKVVEKIILPQAGQKHPEARRAKS
jgi:hypothetical protein